MTEEILPGLYRVVVPLPGNPLKEVNSYILTSPGHNLVIDTGMNRPECQAVLQAGFDELGIDPECTDFLATHLHADHQGLISTMMGERSRAYMGELDTPVFRSGGNTWSKDGFMGNYAERSGFPADDLEASMQNHPGFKYSSARTVDYIPLKEGDTLKVGDYTLEILHTAGHTNGHICLYDREKKLFFSGDHVLGDITPNIATWSAEDDPLDSYLTSLKRVDDLEVDLCLPGHRSLIHNFHDRVGEIIEHHRVRANEVLDILARGSMHAYDTASRMTWSIRAKSWEAFPVMQRWFATGEAIAHLQYLHGKELVEVEEQNDLIMFTSKGGDRL